MKPGSEGIQIGYGVSEEAIEFPCQDSEGLGVLGLVCRSQAAVQGIQIGHGLGWDGHRPSTGCPRAAAGCTERPLLVGTDNQPLTGTTAQIGSARVLPYLLHHTA
jgi:hypothetical protein